MNPYRELRTEKSSAGELGLSWSYTSHGAQLAYPSHQPILDTQFPVRTLTSAVGVELLDGLLLLTLAAAASTSTLTASLSSSGSGLVGGSGLRLVLLGLSDTVSTCPGRHGEAELT